jgi:hypothetical protein
MEREESAETFDEDATASEAVLAAVADREGVDPTELPRLFDAVDADALDAIFADGRPGRVTFTYAGYEITVSGRDRVTVVCEALDDGGERG